MSCVGHDSSSSEIKAVGGPVYKPVSTRLRSVGKGEVRRPVVGVQIDHLELQGRVCEVYPRGVVGPWSGEDDSTGFAVRST